MSSHECPAPGCTAAVPRNQLACRKHWFSLPKYLRDEVWRAYRHDSAAAHANAVAVAIQHLRGES